MGSDDGGRYYFEEGRWKMSPKRDPRQIVVNPKWYEWDLHGRHHPIGTLNPQIDPDAPQVPQERDTGT